MAGFRGWLAVGMIVAAGCSGDARPPEMPALEAVQSAYGEAARPQISGNLVRLTVPMPAGFERGGTLWARSGPYFYLFTTATRDIFATHPDVAAVEVVAVTEEGEEVARARLLSSTLNGITWPQAIAYASHAQAEGTQRPVLVDRLVRYAEERTEYTYNPEFIPPR